MSETKELLRRGVGGFEPMPDAFERVLRRRDRKRRNQRIAAGVLGIAVFALAAIGFARLLGSEDTPADEPWGAFVGVWASTDYNDYFGADNTSSQTMTIRTGEDGVLYIRAQADQTGLSVCSERRPGQDPRYVFFESTMSGTGRLEDPTTLVVPSPVVACPDGGDHRTEGPTRYREEDSYRLVLDPATDRLYDNLGVVWNRGAPPENWEDSSTEAGVDGPGTFSMLHGEVSFGAGEPWNDHVESYIDPRLFFLIGPGDEGAPGGETAYFFFEISVNPLPPETPCDSLRVPASAEELVQAIRSNPDLEATTPVTERVGGIDALRMDVVAAPGASIAPCGGASVPVVSVPGRGAWGGVEPGGLGRLYVLDLHGGSARALAILITAPGEALFERALDAAAPVLDSFEFHPR